MLLYFVNAKFHDCCFKFKFHTTTGSYETPVLHVLIDNNFEFSLSLIKCSLKKWVFFRVILARVQDPLKIRISF